MYIIFVAGKEFHIFMPDLCQRVNLIVKGFLDRPAKV